MHRHSASASLSLLHLWLSQQLLCTPLLHIPSLHTRLFTPATSHQERAFGYKLSGDGTMIKMECESEEDDNYSSSHSARRGASTQAFDDDDDDWDIWEPKEPPALQPYVDYMPRYNECGNEID